MKKLLKWFSVVAIALVIGVVCVSSVTSEVSAAGKTKKITVKVKKNSDITKKVNEALAKASKAGNTKYEITIPKGTYYIKEPLHIYSNTKLIAKGATIKYKAPKKEKHNMIISGTIEKNKSKKSKGYKGYKNISIVGGKWVNADYNEANLMKITHAKNVSIENATFEGGGGIHQVEVCAIDGFTVKNCTFKNFKANSQANSKQEALQLDIPVRDDIFGDTYEDGTVMKNVTITGNRFENVPRGVGSHTLLLGAFHENLKIADNTFVNVHEEAIVTCNYYNCEISNNKIEDCGAGIVVQTFKTKADSIFKKASNAKPKFQNYTEVKTVVKDNTIQTKYYADCDKVQGIWITGGLLQANQKTADKVNLTKGTDYRANGVVVENNTIVTAGHGIHVSGAKNCVVKGNTITGKDFKYTKEDKGFDGIFVRDYSEAVSVRENVIKTPDRMGVFVFENSSVSDITSNQIEESGDCGIRVYGGSGVAGNIGLNTITKSGNIGISLADHSTAQAITGNTLQTASQDGISLYDGSSVAMAIEKNVISNVTRHGIFLNQQCNANSITANKVTSAGENAIFVYSGASVSDAISNNVLTTSGKSGIFLNANSSAKSITGNTIKTTKNHAIYVYSSSNVTGAISENKISDVTGNGIYASDKVTIGSITDNTVTTASQMGIRTINASNVNGDIMRNAITGVPGLQIKIGDNCVVSGTFQL